MSFRDEWQPVNKANPCPICGKHDRCAVKRNGEVAMCYRVEEGSFGGNDGGAGYCYFHRLTADDSAKTKADYSSSYSKPDPAADAEAYDTRARAQSQIWRDCREQMNDQRLAWLAYDLGVSEASLDRLRVGWYPGHHPCAPLTRDLERDKKRGYVFPMTDPTRPQYEAVGHRMRLIHPDAIEFYGRNKISLPNPARGDGLFIPEGIDGESTLVVVEGPTDCAAVLDMGHACIGRANNTSGRRWIMWFVEFLRPDTSDVVLLVDRDRPDSDIAMEALRAVIGRRVHKDHVRRELLDMGLSTAEADTLSAALKLAGLMAKDTRPVRIVAPPLGFKDAREWYRAGATHDDLAGLIDSARMITGTPFWQQRQVA